MGSYSLLQGISPTQGSNPHLLHCRWILYHLSHEGSPRILEWVIYPFSRGSSQPRNRTLVSYIASGFFTSSVTREARSLWSCSRRSLAWFSCKELGSQPSFWFRAGRYCPWKKYRSQPASTLRDISISEKVLALPSALENLPQSDSLNMNEDWVLRSSTRLRHLTWRSLRSPNIRRWEGIM